MARARLSGAGRRHGRGLGWRGLALAAGLALPLFGAIAPSAHAGIGTKLGTVTQKAAQPSGGSTCGRATGPFTVRGAQVVDGGGNPFVSYGLTVAGLQGMDWTHHTAEDLLEIAATAQDWCANTVRLQVDQDSLVGAQGTGFNRAYLAAIENEVSLAEHYQLVVVINDETNYSPAAVLNSELGPTPATEAFWKDLAKIYGKDPQVIFDLFNEPRTYSSSMSLDQEWHLWLDGGTYNGVVYPFGMAALATYVRATLGARNLFWIEGPDYSASFAGITQEHALLAVKGVVYAVHHPAGEPDLGSWQDDFGFLIAEQIAPVVDGEWTNYEPAPTAGATSARSSCWPSAPTAVPAFLTYLNQYGVGLNAYTLQPGYLIQSYSDLADPTTMNANSWSCQSASEPQPNQSAGAAILAWFEQENG